MSVNYDRVCRLCLSSRGELLPIFSTTSSDDTESPVLALKIKDCVAVQISENDELPTNVCKKCLDNVNNWHIFKSVCEKTQIKLLSLKNDGSNLDQVNVKSEPLYDEAYDDGVIIDGLYPDQETAAHSKLLPEGPPILASLGLTPRSDKGIESEKEEENYEEVLNESHNTDEPVPNIPEVSVTVTRSTGETLQARQGIQKLASKSCLICGRSYRYSHNARRHELNSHDFDRYTNKLTNKKSMHSMQPKLRPNPFNLKARLMPNPISHKMQLLPKPLPSHVPQKIINTPKPIPIKAAKPQNLPYPLRIKALKDLQIKKKEPQILKTLLTTKPEVLITEPEIMNSRPASPETLISEPEIASFQVETILSEEPDDYNYHVVEEVDEEMNKNSSQNYDTVEMESDHEIEIARKQEEEYECEENDTEGMHKEGNFEEEINSDIKEQNEEVTAGNKGDTGNDDEIKENGEHQEENDEDDIHDHESEEREYVEGEEREYVEGEEREYVEGENQENEEVNEEKNEYQQEEDLEENGNDGNEKYVSNNAIVPVEMNEEINTNSCNSEAAEVDTVNDPDYGVDDETVAQNYDPDKTYVTKSQRDFINKYRDIIEQINTKQCLCCDKQHPRRKAVIQHLQKNGHKVPKHTCYNCVVTFSHIGALLSHMRANVCTDLWKIIYNESGITDDMVVEDEPKEDKSQHKDILNARSYACKLCPAKFQLKQFVMKHVLDVHEDGQSMLPLICVHCRSRFKERSLWKRHVRNGDCTVCISCDLCTEKFLNMHQFNNHALLVHAGNLEQTDNQTKCVDGRPTDCPICGKKNTGYGSLIKHMKTIHNEETPHYCQHCDAKFELSTDLNKHIYMEHSDRTLSMTVEPDMSVVKEETEEYHYSCTECNDIFETVDAWTDHQVAEHNQIAHHCDQCDKKFLRPSELAEHKNTHLRIKFYPCSVCPNSYSTPQKLTEHIQQVHPECKQYSATDSEFYCDICVRSFKSRQAYSNHMRIHAKVPTTNRKPGENKGFAPQIIGKPIKQFPTMQQQGMFNFKVNNCNVPNAPYSCDICGKGFMHKKNIWKHKKVLHADLVGDRNDSEENTMHALTEDEDYNVDENGILLSTPQFNSFNFTNFTNNIQQQAQQEELPFACEICYKRFPIKSSLWKHMRAKHGVINASSLGNEIPTETSRASCTICKITFSDKKSYYRHRKNVHKSTVQMCKICGKALNSTLELYEHLKSAHARELLGYNSNQSSSKLPEMKQEVEADYEGEAEVADPSAEYQARYPCNTCGKQFVGLLALQNHQCISPGSSQPSTFNCEICNKSYTSIAALKSHRGWHLRSPDGKAAANNSDLWMPHHKVTSKVSKFEVLDPSQLATVQHSTPIMATKRRLPPEVEVTVVNPNKKLRCDDSMDMEQQNVSSVMDDRYCIKCDKEFTKRAAYQRHMDEVHQPNSVFCPVCDKSFTRKSTLLVHMRKHYENGECSSAATSLVGDDTYSCDLCGSQFSNEQALRSHRAKHHADEEDEESDEGIVQAPPPGEFTCGQCGDGVATPRDLIAHRTIHATATKYFCNICKVYFAKASDLSTHSRARHTGTEKNFFPCAMCDKFFSNKKSLQRHIELAH